MPFQTHETIRNHNPIGLPTQDDVSLRHSVHLPSRWKETRDDGREGR